MANTRLDAALQAIGDGARLEQLASDLLRREGYSVDPTGTRGPDGGRDSLLSIDNEQGILHCSVAEEWESKIKSDVESARNRPEDFEFFLFATIQNPAGIMRDRVEEEIAEEYGWRVRIYDFERLRNRLMGNRENHDLAREHLSVDPGHAFDDISSQINDRCESFLERLHEREAPYGSIRSDLPFAAVHIIPAESLNDNFDRIAVDLPDPPCFASRSGLTQRVGDAVITCNPTGLEDEPYAHYTSFHIEGWMEAVSTYVDVAQADTPQLTYGLDRYIVHFVEQALESYEQANIYPPFFVYITLIDAADYTMSKPPRMTGPAVSRDLGTDEFRLNRVTIKSYDEDVPNALRRPLYQLWNRAGWSTGSINYNELEDDTGEIRYEWDPYAE
ncbi:hypothetical protein [Halobacterium yunchengense]|uniref:hypothetical protein n=1 Tax=Halobacterium yunchengense TaxID=3108497 RepID=UPI003008C76D